MKQQTNCKTTGQNDLTFENLELRQMLTGTATLVPVVLTHSLDWLAVSSTSISISPQTMSCATHSNEGDGEISNSDDNPNPNPNDHSINCLSTAQSYSFNGGALSVDTAQLDSNLWITLFAYESDHRLRHENPADVGPRSVTIVNGADLALMASDAHQQTQPAAPSITKASPPLPKQQATPQQTPRSQMPSVGAYRDHETQFRNLKPISFLVSTDRGEVVLSQSTQRESDRHEYFGADDADERAGQKPETVDKLVRTGLLDDFQSFSLVDSERHSEGQTIVADARVLDQLFADQSVSLEFVPFDILTVSSPSDDNHLFDARPSGESWSSDVRTVAWSDSFPINNQSVTNTLPHVIPELRKHAQISEEIVAARLERDQTAGSNRIGWVPLAASTVIFAVMGTKRRHHHAIEMRASDRPKARTRDANADSLARH